jgi:hypothetical protein
MSAPGKHRIPPLGGVATLEEAARPGFSVAEATRRLRRFAYVQQRLALLAAAHLNSTPEWEVKAALALHAWLDAEHASALRRRLLELREPEARLDDVPDKRLASALDELLHSRDTVELLTGVYGVARPALLEAIERYLRETNPLADQPSCRALKLIAIEEREAIEWGRAALEAVTTETAARERGAAWGAHLCVYLAAAGGIDGTQAPAEQKLPRPRAAKKFTPEVLPQRDARFAGLYDSSTPADVVYLDEARPAHERNVALLFKRLREMDVPEVIAGILAQTSDKPWPYFAEMLRQMWDEARHALLGEAALAARGVDWTRLPVNVTFSYKLAKYCSPVERHILLYAIEQSLMPARRGKRYEWEIAREAGDPLSTTFQDFDWADEVLHVAIARRQLRPDFKGGLEEARRRSDKLWARISRALEDEPMPDDAPPPDWWERYVESVLGRAPEPVAQTDVKDWRPLSA